MHHSAGFADELGVHAHCRRSDAAQGCGSRRPGGCDSIRIPKTEHAEDVHRVAAAIAEDLGTDVSAIRIVSMKKV